MVKLYLKYLIANDLMNSVRLKALMQQFMLVEK